jgi:hypothetical protein
LDLYFHWMPFLFFLYFSAMTCHAFSRFTAFQLDFRTAHCLQNCLTF